MIASIEAPDQGRAEGKAEGRHPGPRRAATNPVYQRSASRSPRPRPTSRRCARSSRCSRAALDAGPGAGQPRAAGRGRARPAEPRLRHRAQELRAAGVAPRGPLGVKIDDSRRSSPTSASWSRPAWRPRRCSRAARCWPCCRCSPRWRSRAPRCSASAACVPPSIPSRRCSSCPDRPILGSVSLIRGPEQPRTQRDVYRFAGVMGVFLAVHVVWVVLIARHGL